MDSALRRAFTLVEVLVAISIVAILVAILIVITRSSKSAAGLSACLSEIHQLGLAGRLYVDDYDQTFPPHVDRPIRDGEPTSDWPTWRDKVSPYLGSMLKCPQAAVAEDVPKSYLWGYAINDLVNRTLFESSAKTLVPKAASIVENPSDVVFFADCNLFDITLSSTDESRMHLVALVAVDLLKKYRHLPPASTRHNGGANYSLMDGSAKMIRPVQLKGKDGRFTFFIPRG
ncbi:MAG: type II secretion system protein [Armatimonadetes bacterium]|nr:type II secretion system protein [Armatimonadota bacterium]MBX3108717.1 type II secretion system protein [Fimbriimonadaceae bacterium]